MNQATNKQLWDVSCETREGRIEDQVRAPDREAAVQQFKSIKRVVEETDPRPATYHVVGSRLMAIQL